MSILAGVNEFNGAVPAADYEQEYRALLKQTKEKLPAVRLVLCEPFLLPVGKMKEDWVTKSTDMKSRQEIVRKLAGESDAIFVALQEDFNKACIRAPADYWIWDGIHPMPAGHELIARKWIHTVGKELHFIR